MLSGADEGAFQWLTLNYLLGNLGAGVKARGPALGERARRKAHSPRRRRWRRSTWAAAACSWRMRWRRRLPRRRRQGALARLLPLAAPGAHSRLLRARSYVRSLSGGGVRYDVYVHSYLGFGLMAGRAAVLKAGKAESHPCIAAKVAYTYGCVSTAFPVAADSSHLNERMPV